MPGGASAAKVLVREHNVLLTLPEVCLRLRSLLAEPAHSRRQVADVIRHDPALAARLLRIVNSAWYGLATPVRDISQALGILGEHELHHLAVVTAIVRNTAALKPGFDLRLFWQQSVFAATLAQQLHPWCPALAREELFIAGLLLDIGKPLLYAREPGLHAVVQAALAQGDRRDVEVERELLGFDHAEVGAALAAHWNFPDYLPPLILGHHDARQTTAPLPLLQAVAWCAYAVGGNGEPPLPHELPQELTQELAQRATAAFPALPAAEEMAQVMTAACEQYRQVYELFCGGGS